MMKCVAVHRYAAVVCSALIAAAACSSGGSPSRPVGISVATPTVEPSGQHFSMPSACVLATSQSKSILLGGKLHIGAHESDDTRGYCEASTTSRGSNRSVVSVTVHSWPTGSVAANSVTSSIKSGQCEEIAGVADSACMKAAPGIVHVYVARGNIDVVASFRLVGLVKNDSKVAGYARQYAESVSQSIR